MSRVFGAAGTRLHAPHEGQAPQAREGSAAAGRVEDEGQDGRHGGDADPAGDQDYGVGPGFKIEVTGGGANLKYRTHLDMVVEEIRGTARGMIAHRRGKHSLDRNAVMIGLGGIRQ